MRVPSSVRPKARRLGFTLVEVLVTTIVVGVMAAVVVPAMMKQVGAADPARIASDLRGIKTGIENFSINMKPRFPGDLEDLVNEVNKSSSADRGADGTAYTNEEFWKGPYVERQLPDVGEATGGVWSVGATPVAALENDLKICNMDAAANGCSAVTSGNAFLSIQINNISEDEFEAINAILDGQETEGAGESWQKGSFRYASSTSNAFYLAVPYTAP